MIFRTAFFLVVVFAALGSFSSGAQAQACTDVSTCPAGYTAVDCSMTSCSGVFVAGPACIVGTSGDDNILVFGGGGHLVCGNDGNDTVQFVNSTSAVFVWGGNGADSLTGTAFNDFLFGEGDDDTLLGGGGDDFLSGGAGDDDLSGQGGNDTVNGDAGADILSGGSGQDTLNGGDGDDQLNGNAGVDTLNGQGGNDTLLSDGNTDGDSYSGGAGDDRIFADGGNNTINGGAGNDYIEGGDGNDTIIGGTGYDQLFGQAGADDIQGGDDPDVLDGGAGIDSLDGGGGNDTCLSGESNLNCENLTAARLHSSVAYPFEGGTVIEWQTLFEAGTAGFELRVREGDKWRPLHRGLLAADVAGYAGARYAYFLPNWDGAAEYEIREIENSGLRRSLGTLRATGLSQRPIAGLSRELPFVSKGIEVDQTWRLAPLERSERRLLVGAPTFAKVEVAQDGLQRVSLSALATELGISMSDLEGRIDGETLAVKLGDEQVSWTRQGEHLVFVGMGSDSPYSAGRIYRLELAEGERAATAQRVVDADASVLTKYRATTVVEDDKFAARVVPIDPSQDTWFSHVLSPTTPGKEQVVLSIDLEGYAGGDATIELELQGASFDPQAAVEHVFDVEVNGSAVGEAQLSGFGRETFVLSVPANALSVGQNQVAIIATLRGSEASIAYLDRVAVSYDREFSAQDDMLTFVADTTGTVRIPGFSTANISLVEVAADGTTRAVEGADVESGESFEIAFAARAGARYYLSASAPNIEVWGDSAATLRELQSGAEYVIVTRADLISGAEELASLRREQGFSTLVVDVDDVYDAYSGSQPSPDAIRAFFEDAYERWATKPLYAVLAGASHFDYRDRLGFGVPLVPAYQVRLHNGIVSSDLPMVDFDQNGVPEIALGRLPAGNSDELAAMVRKIVAYERLSDPVWASNVTLVADRADDSTDFAADIDAFAEQLPDHLSSSKLLRKDMEAEAIRSGIKEQVASGTAWIHYLGHGGISQWSQGSGILASADVDAWGTNEAQPFVTAGTCLTGAYDFPGVRSLGEAWIGADGGAIGVWGATASTIHAESDLYSQSLRKALAEDGRLRVGDALRAASESHVAEKTEFGLETLRAYTVLGDPATVLHISHPNPNVLWPSGGGVDVSREIRGTEATYETTSNPLGADPVDDGGWCSLSRSSHVPLVWLIGVLGLLLSRRRRR